MKAENNSSDATAFEWDFCPRDIENLRRNEELSVISGLNGGYGYKLIEDDGEWFGFVTSENNHSIFRLDFGNNPTNSPVVTNLGNPGGLLVFPEDIEVAESNGKWYAFIGSFNVNQGIVRLEFGTSLLNNAPKAENIGNFGFSTRFRGLKVVQQNSELVLLLAGYNLNSLIRINYRDSFDNAIGVADIFDSGTVSGLGNPIGMDITKNSDGDIIMLVSSYNGNSISQLNFGADILSNPTVEATYHFAEVIRPYYVKISREADQCYAVVSNESQALTILNLYDLNPANPPDVVSNTSLPVAGGIEAFRLAGKTYLHSAGTSNNKLRQLTFESLCDSSLPFYEGYEPPLIAYSESGVKTVDLRAFNENGEYDVTSRWVTISTDVSPDIAFTSVGMCSKNEVSFASYNSSGSIATYTWNFGDGEQASVANPVHQFIDPGEYEVSLSVKAVDGCENVFNEIVRIYNKPLSDFELPLDLLCTNNVITLTATTPDIYNGNLLYQWFVDDQLAGSQRDLQYTFTSTGTREVRLRTSIPGCADEIAKTTPPVEAGPAVDFSFNGVCEGDPFGFQSQVSQPINSYHWDFDNGAVSSDPDPSLTFADPGDYAVSLSATNEIGCQTIKTKTVAVHSRPVIDFSAEGLSNACSGQKTYFDNQSTNPDGRAITDWQWAFGDALDTTPSSAASGEHVYDDAGAYNVSLTASTAAGCSASLQKEITIRPSPSTNFTSSPPCEDVAVLFKRPPGGDIASVYWEIGTLYYDEDTLTHVFNSPGDYPFYLEVSSVNGCHSTLSKTIHVPQKLSPDFSVIRNCVNQEAVFTDLTTGQDPVTLREWNLGTAESFSGSQLYYTFTEQTSRSIKLDVTTAAGCSYHVTKTVAIGPGPRANFSAVPSSGAYPLEVAFVNTSSMATHYLWQFSGINVNSTEQSPVVVFPDEGNFDVKLTAFNAQQCEDTFTGTVTAVVPAPDAEIELVNLIRNSDGSAKVVVTIHNVGNTLLKNVPLRFDFAGTLLLQQMVDGPVLPGAKYNFVFNAAIANLETLPYLCVSIDLENDLTPQGNRKCLQFEPELLVFPAFPNPASGTLNVEWISDADTHIRFALIDQVGRTILTSGRATLSGLNQIKLDIRNLDNGHYILLINDGSTESRQRIIIINRP